MKIVVDVMGGDNVLVVVVEGVEWVWDCFKDIEFDLFGDFYQVWFFIKDVIWINLIEMMEMIEMGEELVWVICKKKDFLIVWVVVVVKEG